MRTSSVPRLKLDFAPCSTPPGVASIARAYSEFSVTSAGLSPAVSISPLGILAIGAITLIILSWAVCAFFASKNRHGVLIQMQDSGKGIGSEQLERIFEPFFTTKSQGFGLGLSISRSIIESLGGRLWATSASPLGATFHFTLPTTDRFHE